MPFGGSFRNSNESGRAIDRPCVDRVIGMRRYPMSCIKWLTEIGSSVTENPDSRRQTASASALDIIKTDIFFRIQ